MQIISKRLIIRPIEKKDLPIVLAWWNDPEMMYFANDDPHPIKTLQELEFQFQKETNEWKDSMTRFIIKEKGGELIGDIMYGWYREDVRSAYMGIFIGEKHCWGKGYGMEAIKIFLKYLFNEKKLHKVAITVSEFNRRAIHVYEKCGFHKDGILKHNAVVDGKYIDHIIMSILEDEFRKEI